MKYFFPKESWVSLLQALNGWTFPVQIQGEDKKTELKTLFSNFLLMPEKVSWRPHNLHFSSARKTLAIIIIIFKNMYFLRNECYYLPSIICKKLEFLTFKLAVINNFCFLTVQYTKPENLVQIPRIHGLHKPKIIVVKHIKIKTKKSSYWSNGTL